MKSTALIVGASLALIALVGSAAQTRAATILDQQYLITDGLTAGFTGGGFPGFRRVQTFTVGVTGTLSEVDIFVLGDTFTGFNLSTSGGVPTTVIGTETSLSATSGVAVFSIHCGYLGKSRHRADFFHGSFGRPRHILPPSIELFPQPSARNQ